VEFDMSVDDDTGELVFNVPDSDQPISPQLVGSYVVHHLMQITKLVMGHDNVKSAVICVPAKFNTEQRQATYQAFKQAGVTVARIVEEPTAAALAYGLHRKEGVDYILVYDFGGGTLDVSLLHVSDGFVDVMGSDGDDRLGGADFDAAVAHFLLEHRGGNEIVRHVTAALQHLADDMPSVDLEDKLSASCPALATIPLCTTSSFHTLSEQLKIGLSEYPDHDGSGQAVCLSLLTTIMIDDTLSLDTFCSSLTQTTLTLTSQEYDETVQSLYDRSILPIERLLSDLDLTSDDIDEIVMVGGTTRMPQIRTLVRQTLPTAAMNTHIDPDITVAYGAASVID
jgi:molecular chaperone DnaK (HSP70)